MEKITVDQVKSAIQEHQISWWPVRDCSICGNSVSYQFSDIDNPFPVGLDTNCGCTRYRSPLVEMSIEYFIERTFNLQTQPEMRKKMWQDFVASGVSH